MNAKRNVMLDNKVLIRQTRYIHLILIFCLINLARLPYTTHSDFDEILQACSAY